VEVTTEAAPPVGEERNHPIPNEEKDPELHPFPGGDTLPRCEGGKKVECLFPFEVAAAGRLACWPEHFPSSATRRRRKNAKKRERFNR